MLTLGGLSWEDLPTSSEQQPNSCDCDVWQGRVTANGRVGATAAVYTAAILGKGPLLTSRREQISNNCLISISPGSSSCLRKVNLDLCRVSDSRSPGARRERLKGPEGMGRKFALGSRLLSVGALQALIECPRLQCR